MIRMLKQKINKKESVPSPSTNEKFFAVVVVVSFQKSNWQLDFGFWFWWGDKRMLRQIRDLGFDWLISTCLWNMAGRRKLAIWISKYPKPLIANTTVSLPPFPTSVFLPGASGAMCPPPSLTPLFQNAAEMKATDSLWYAFIATDSALYTKIQDRSRVAGFWNAKYPTNTKAVCSFHPLINCSIFTIS